MTSDDRRSGIADIKPDIKSGSMFMFSFVEFAHLRLLPNERKPAFSKRATGSPPTDSFCSSLFLKKNNHLLLCPSLPFFYGSFQAVHLSVLLIKVVSNLHFFLKTHHMYKTGKSVAGRKCLLLVFHFYQTLFPHPTPLLHPYFHI